MGEPKILQVVFVWIGPVIGSGESTYSPVHLLLNTTNLNSINVLYTVQSYTGPCVKTVIRTEFGYYT